MNMEITLTPDIQFLLDDLSPYFSVVLMCNEEPFTSAKKQSAQLHEWLEILKVFPAEGARTFIHESSTREDMYGSNCYFTAFHYSERRKAPWTRDANIQDYTNHLVLLASWENLSAIYFSENSLKEKFASFIFSNMREDKWPRPLERSKINSSFAHGISKTIWLTGIHRRQSIRADTKILTGSKIQDALNPIDDQSYYFTSTRCLLRDWNDIAGISVRKSQLWIRKCVSWEDYKDVLKRVFERLKIIKPIGLNPFPILATPITDIAPVNSAFDMHFLYPEILAEDEPVDDQIKIQTLVDLCDRAQFIVTPVGKSPNLQAEVLFDCMPIGAIGIDFDKTPNSHGIWGFSLSILKNPNNKLELIQEFREYIQIRYESGHTYSEGEFYSQNYRDLPFEKWNFQDFDDYHINVEKPEKFMKMGSDKSLFCWVWNNTDDNCWLYCDDRSGEVADFIKLQEWPRKPPKLSLIHVKAANCCERRRFSVSAYEVVTAQAIKNLRHFNVENLISQIQNMDNERFMYRVKRYGVKPKNKEEAGVFKAEFISKLQKSRANVEREVVVLQPHNSKSMIRGKKVNKNARFQLQTLLLAAEIACKGLGADFTVIVNKK